MFKTLDAANMKIQLDKSEFLKREIEFLGYVVSREGIGANPKKVQAIIDLPPPRNLKELRSFLGMTGYYRRFIRDYAKIAKPLTSLLQGEDEHVSKHHSKNKLIEPNEECLNAFNKIKNSLVSKEVILAHSNFKNEFELTTDASGYAIGAVLQSVT